MQKKTTLFLLLLLFVYTPALFAQRFVHPGVPFTQGDLDLLKQNITQEPWLTAYNNFKNDSHSKLTYGMRGPVTTVGRAPNLNVAQWENDMIAIHNLAFMWVFTGDTAYARKATDMLEAWAVTNRRWMGDEDFLEIADYAFYVIPGADILRSTYPGWTAANTAHVKDWFGNVLWKAADVPNPIRGHNQGAAQCMIAVGLAAFLDDPVKWQQAIDVYRTDAGGGLACSLPNGEVGDAGRDEGHWFGEIVQLAWCAEVAWKQGIDLFADLDNRVLATSELYAKFNLDTTGMRSQFIPFGGTYAYYTGFNAPGGSRRQHMLYNIIQGAYPLRKGVQSPYSTTMRDLLTENNLTFLYRKSADTSTAASVSPVVYPTGTPAASLTNRDVGKTGLAGSAAFSNGTWTLNGAGDIPVPPLSVPDAFNYAFQKITGDAVIIAKVTSIGSTDPNARAGLMFRESLAADARFVGMFLQNQKVNLTWRAATAWSKTNLSWNNPPGGYLEHWVPQNTWWLKLVRRGNKIAAYHTRDSINWTCLGIAVSPMPETVYVGLTSSSHNTSALSTATFTNVAITKGSPEGAPEISSPTAANAVVDTPFSYTVTANGNPTSYSATGLPAGLNIDTATGIISGTPATAGTALVTLNAANANGAGSIILVLNVLSNTAPAPPVLSPIANSGINKNTLSWNQVPAATTYTVKRSLTAGGPYTTIISGVTDTSFTDASAYPGPNYYIITALAGELESNASNLASIILPPGIPSKPVIVNQDSQLNISWPAATGAASYNIKRSTSSGGPYTTIATGLTDTSYLDTNLTNGTYYYYVVSSVISSSESLNSIEELGVPGAWSGTWSTTAADTAWSTAASWEGGIAPVSPAILRFGTSATTTLTNNITALEVPRITFTPGASAYVINGNEITAGTDITNNSTTAQIINTPLLLNRTLTVNVDSGSVRLAGAIRGTGALVKHGSTALTVSGANTFTGGTTIYDSNGGWPPNGVLNVTGVGTDTSGPLGTGPIVMSGGALRNEGTAVLYNDVIIKENTKSYFYAPAGGFTLAGKLKGSGTVELDNDNYNGFMLTGDNSEFTGTFISKTRSSYQRMWFSTTTSGSAKATWILNSNFTDAHRIAQVGTYHFGALEGTGLLNIFNNIELSIGALNKDCEFKGLTNGTSARFTKVGTAKFTLSGLCNNYGVTTVKGGKLMVNGEIASPVVVDTGLLGGLGYIASSITVNAGAILAPGDDNIGELTTRGLLTLQPGAIFKIETNAQQADTLSAKGVIINNAVLSVQKTGGDAYPTGARFLLADNTSTTPVTGTFSGLPELAILTLDGVDFRITYKGGDGNDIVLMDDRTVGLTITSAEQDTLLAGDAYNYQLTAIKSPTHFYATGLPAGLTIDTATGIISGAVNQAGAYTVTLSASNGSTADTITLALVVKSTSVEELIVASGDAKNIVEWTPVMSRLTYNVKRTETVGGPYTLLANTTTAKYIDSAVTNGKTYYYAIALVDSAKQYPNSPAVTARPNIGQHGYWKFDEASGTKAIDAWGANHATLAATATRNAGYVNTALKLDGSATSYASLPAGVVSTLNDFTITTWIKMDALTSWMRVFDFGNSTSYYMFLTVQAGITSGKSIVRYAIKNGGAEQQVSYNYTFPLNTWVHFALSQSGNTCRLYINGVLVSTNTNVTIKPSALGSTALNYLGKSQFNDPLLKGSLDLFKIFNRGLSAAEIAAGMAAEKVTLKVWSDVQTTDTSIKPSLKVLNVDSTSVPYNELTLRYWFTPENYAGINTWIDYAALGNNKVNTQYITLDTPRNGALGYIEYSFDSTAGILTGNNNSGIISSRFANTNWALLDKTNDYSYQNDVNENITLYRNGKLVWGIEPAAVSSVVQLKAFTQSTSNSANTIGTYLRIQNEGNVPVAYNDLAIKYWFTPEGAKPLNFQVDYAALGNDKVTGIFQYADTSLELHINSSAGSLYPLSNTGNIQYRLYKSDWSPFVETNDHSYLPVSSLTENMQVTIYYKGQLIYGVEPVAARISKPVEPLDAALKVFPNPASEQLIISVDKVVPDALLQVFDNKGMLIHTERLVNTISTVNISKWTQGTYYLKIKNGDSVTARKIVKY